MPFARSGFCATAKVFFASIYPDLSENPAVLQNSGRECTCHPCNFFALTCYFTKRWVIFPQTKESSEGAATQARLESDGAAKVG